MGHWDRNGGRAGLAAEVSAAIDERRLVLALQPVVNARRPDRVAFHEGLVRMIRRDGSVLAAGGFVPAVEALPVGRELDCAALELALEALEARDDLRLSVNVSALTLGDALWEWTLDAAAERDPTVTERLIVEVTESAAAADPEQVAAFARRVRRLGVALAVDDFGAGYTALRHLRDIRFDIVKIDGGFSRAIDRDPDNRAVVAAIAGLARHFDALVVAEQVETEAEAAALAAQGVDALQGYHFGRPALPDRPPQRLRA